MACPISLCGRVKRAALALVLASLPYVCVAPENLISLILGGIGGAHANELMEWAVVS